MKKGDKVMVYQDPLTEQREEGEAKLLKEITDSIGIWEGRNLSLWEVRFSDGEKATRKILEPEDAGRILAPLREANS